MINFFFIFTVDSILFNDELYSLVFKYISNVINSTKTYTNPHWANKVDFGVVTPT